MKFRIVKRGNPCDPNAPKKQYASAVNAYINKGDYDKVIESYNKAIKLKPDEKHTYIAVGELYRWFRILCSSMIM
jgi:tetratricopeptide (TPR) repeat protein